MSFLSTLEHLSITSVIWRQEVEFYTDITPSLSRSLPVYLSLFLSPHVAPWVALRELWETAPLTVENLHPWHFLPPPYAMQQSQHLLPLHFSLMSLSVALDQHLPLVNKAFPMGDRATQVALNSELKNSNDYIWGREE